MDGERHRAVFPSRTGESQLLVVRGPSPGSHGPWISVDDSIASWWAEWAGPSRAIAPAIETVARKYAGRVKVGKVNVDDYPKLTDQFSVTKLPTIIVINQGSKQQRIAGPISKEEISQMLDKQLGSNP